LVCLEAVSEPVTVDTDMFWMTTNVHKSPAHSSNVTTWLANYVQFSVYINISRKV